MIHKASFHFPLSVNRDHSLIFSFPILSGDKGTVYITGSLIIYKGSVLCGNFWHNKVFLFYLRQLSCKNIRPVFCNFLQIRVL